jgi:thiol-disulfide isomerase/thioredoxin
MKNFNIIFILILFYSANVPAKWLYKADSTKSFILTERALPDDQKTGEISSAFWDVELKTMDGKILKMKSYRGKYVYLNFWGEWCPGCREEMPSIVQAYKIYKNKVEFIGLLKPHDIIKAKKFINDQDIIFPQVILSKIFKKRFNFDGFPLSILIFPDGRNYISVDEVNKQFFDRDIK